jgi:hypothetical protein
MGAALPARQYGGEGGGEGGVVHGGFESVGRISKTWRVLVLYDYRPLSLPAAGKGGRMSTLR